MKYKVTRFKSMKLGLKELEPYIRNGEHLQTGKPFKRFGDLRSRELLANWLLCAVANGNKTDRLIFSSDPLGGDGIIYDSETGETWPTEHILVPKLFVGKRKSYSRSAIIPGQLRAKIDSSQSSVLDSVGKNEVENRILAAIGKKWSKGRAAYASGKTLIVFLNAGGGTWHPNKVARFLPKPLYFEAVWVVGLQRIENDEYLYGVTRLDLSRGHAPTWLIKIKKDFSSWVVEPIQ